MGWWQISADTLAQSRFVVSPLAETVAAMMALCSGTAAYPGERQWVDLHRPGYQEYLSGDPLGEALVRSALGRNWIADFLTPTPSGAEGVTFEGEVARVRATSDETARADLAVASGDPLPDQLRVTSGLGHRAADLLGWVWTQAVLPYWNQRRRIIEADVLARTRQLSLGGWAAALDGMQPKTRWLGQGRLQINGHDYPPRELSGVDLLFVPVTPRQGWVSWEEPSRYAIVYPCLGVLADQGRAPVPEALGRLLGPARAQVLVLLDTPKSTTQLVALTGQGLGSVGRHLKVLLDAGLVVRRRAGRTVLYSRLAPGDALVEAQWVGRAVNASDSK
jgi:DNA-binding transcriptional ArsR family regulator